MYHSYTQLFGVFISCIVGHRAFYRCGDKYGINRTRRKLPENVTVTIFPEIDTVHLRPGATDVDIYVSEVGRVSVSTTPAPASAPVFVKAASA